MRPFRDIVRQRILNLTVKSLNDLFPDSMANLFKRSSHRYVTRAKTNLSLALPKAKTNAGKTRFSFRVARYILADAWRQIWREELLCSLMNAFSAWWLEFF